MKRIKHMTMIFGTITVLLVPVVFNVMENNNKKDNNQTTLLSNENEVIIEPTKNDKPQKKQVDTFASDKDEIWHKMLNTVDYYDSIDGEFFYSISSIDDVYAVSFNADIDSSKAFSNASKLEINDINNLVTSIQLNEFPEFKKAGSFDLSLYSDGENYYRINNIDNTYTTYKYAAIKKIDSIAEDDKSRFTIREDGIPCYSYRPDSTNAYLAKRCIFPQEMAFGYLANFDLWEIKGTEKIFNRECYVITGNTSDDYGKKTGVNSFEFYIDKETGTLLKYYGYDQSNNLCDFLIISKINFNSPQEIIAPDFNKYIEDSDF